MKRILKLVVIGSAALALLSCQRLENLKHYYDTHMVFGESAGFSFIPGVLAERSDDRIILEFDRNVDDDVSIYDTRSFVDLYYGKDGYIQVCVK
ncbi:MAG: hypothetical protein MJY74_07900, partial [Bacteroidaceae bacterium]|nr:hypothetical protein [Bacteroidaceae bacterium]